METCPPSKHSLSENFRMDAVISYLNVVYKVWNQTINTRTHSFWKVKSCVAQFSERTIYESPERPVLPRMGSCWAGNADVYVSQKLMPRRLFSHRFYVSREDALVRLEKKRQQIIKTVPDVFPFFATEKIRWGPFLYALKQVFWATLFSLF